MDLAQLDAGAAANIRPGDVVTLIGKDAGAEQTLEDLAACTGRTPYEWLTGLGPRIPRVYMQRGQPVAVTTPDNDLTLEC